MTKYHKHKGMESNGKLKSHPIESTHKDSKVQQWHNLALKGKTPSTGDNKVVVPIDKSNYMSLDLNSVKCKGLKLTFTRNRKQVGIIFDKE